jgi:transcriptional regulator
VYVNRHFRENAIGELHRIIAVYPFGIVIGGDPPAAAHIPFVLHPDQGPNGTLLAHTAAADPLAQSIAEGAPLLVIFNGPHAYVRSRWYTDPGLPTYNFVAVHVRGRARPISDPSEVRAHLAELIRTHERGSDDPLTLREAPDGYIEPLLAHITPFELEIDSIVGKFKLSQNRSASDRHGVVGGLRDRRGPGDDEAIAELMEGRRYDSDDAEPLLDGPGQSPARGSVSRS